MVCSKCLKLLRGTTLATPGVKKKSEMYHGSPASSSSKSATLGQTGIGKSKLLSKNAKNPYAQYARLTWHIVCHMCGKPNKKTSSNAPQISGQKFSMK
ncbi:cript family protein [Diaporthe helianthi]|uniref:Cript family protein n=1 Tax=Diaporthe helianthi TaxID=158607 RepID=A0A2P5IDD6_DIAHE|nr:cript family protein [Diaporthe helianthi]